MTPRTTKRKPRERSRGPQPARRPPTARRAAFPLRTIVIGGAVVAAALALWALSRQRASAPGSDEVTALAPEEAYHRALSLGQRERFTESLPYYRRALTGRGLGFPDVHFNYATTLYNLAIQYRQRCGRQVEVSHSSAEQVERTREALAQIDEALRLESNRRDRARMLAFRSNLLSVWGFSWEALASLRAAQSADPARTEFGERAGQLMDLMREPNARTKSEATSRR
jgi:tetratricopeptide (TPR) repeat protein